MEGPAIQIAIMVLFGIVCAAIASSRGRSTVGWFLLGFLVPCLALILICVLPDLKAQEEREARLRNENRRLRERVKKDRMVADQRHDVVSQRLGVHDQALHLDTSEATLENSDGPPPLPETAETESFSSHEWHYADGQQSKGPVSFYDLRMLWRSGSIDETTMVWTEKEDDWKVISLVPGLKEALDG